MDRETFDEIKAEFNEALPNLIAGLPDRTDMMIPLCRAVDWDYERFPDPPTVKSAVMEVYGIRLAELYSRGRRDEVAQQARWMASYVMSEHCGLSLTETGRQMRRDHSSIIYACRRMHEMVKKDPTIARRHQRILRMLGFFE